MGDYRITLNQGSPYVFEANSSDEANESFEIIAKRRGLDKLENFEVLSIELLEDERPSYTLDGVKIT
jgi:hypothetical protein